MACDWHISGFRPSHIRNSSVADPYFRIPWRTKSRMQQGIRVGIDLVLINDVAQSLDRFGDRYVRRVFTSREAEDCRRVPADATARYAARFAAKEATLKALRPSDEAVDWRNIEVCRREGGWCDIVLHGAAAELAGRAGIASLSLSMSHEAGYATAVVVACGSFSNDEGGM